MSDQLVEQPSSSSNSSLLGVLELTIVRAELTHDTETFGKMDPYVVGKQAG